MSVARLQDEIFGRSLSVYFGTIHANDVLLGNESVSVSLSTVQAQVASLSSIVGASHGTLSGSQGVLEALSTITSKVNALDAFVRAVNEAVVIEGASYP